MFIQNDEPLDTDKTFKEGTDSQDIKKTIAFAEISTMTARTEPAHSPELHELFAAMSKAQGAMKQAQKTQENKYFDSMYADYADIWIVAQKPLADNGLTVMHFPTQEDGTAGQISVVGHSSGQWMSTQLMLPVPMSKEGTRLTTSYAATMSYAKRLNMQSICNIASDEFDDDMQGAETSPKIPAKDAAELMLRIEALADSDRGKKTMLTRFCKKFGVEVIGDLTVAQFDEADSAVRDKELGK